MPPVWNSAATVSRSSFLGAIRLSSGCTDSSRSNSKMPTSLRLPPPTRNTARLGIAFRISSTLGQMSANSDGSAAIRAREPASFMMPAICEALRK